MAVPTRRRVLGCRRARLWPAPGLGGGKPRRYTPMTGSAPEAICAPSSRPCSGRGIALDQSASRRQFRVPWLLVAVQASGGGHPSWTCVRDGQPCPCPTPVPDTRARHLCPTPLPDFVQLPSELRAITTLGGDGQTRREGVGRRSRSLESLRTRMSAEDAKSGDKSQLTTWSTGAGTTGTCKKRPARLGRDLELLQLS